MALVLTVVPFTGCSDGVPSGPEAISPAPDGIVQETSISGTIFHDGSLRLEDGSEHVYELPAHSFTLAIPDDGIAARRLARQPTSLEEALAGLSPIIGVSARERTPNVERSLTFVDGDGRQHALSFVRAGARLLRVEHGIDGVTISKIERSWREQQGLWLLSRSSLTVTYGGRRLDLNAAVQGGPGAASFAGLVTNIGANPDLRVYYVEEDNALDSCTGATLELIGASGALAVAIGTGNPLLIAIAAATYLAAVDNYIEQCG
jgi:hypothetical protein